VLISVTYLSETITVAPLPEPNSGRFVEVR
jgi:hypothetical protein